MYYTRWVTDGQSKYWPECWKGETEEKPPKWSGKEWRNKESNNWRHSKLANMAKSDWKPVTSVILENSYRFWRRELIEWYSNSLLLSWHSCVEFRIPHNHKILNISEKSYCTIGCAWWKMYHRLTSLYYR